jgi:hypothetical protein
LHAEPQSTESEEAAAIEWKNDPSPKDSWGQNPPCLAGAACCDCAAFAASALFWIAMAR